MVKQKAYILIACLVFISCLMLLCLSMVDEMRTQKRLLNILHSSDQDQVTTLFALQDFFRQLAIAPDACGVSWQLADQVFVKLKEERMAFCLKRINGVEIRYAFVKTPYSLEVDGIYRVKKDSPWLFVQKDLNA